jgi:hypothetical protein
MPNFTILTLWLLVIVSPASAGITTPGSVKLRLPSPMKPYSYYFVVVGDQNPGHDSPERCRSLSGPDSSHCDGSQVGVLIRSRRQSHRGTIDPKEKGAPT